MNKFAVVFPGQGSQSVGMLSGYAEQFTIIKETVQQASDVLGYDMWALITQGPADKLNQTIYTQPALLTADVAMWRAWCEQHDTQPSYMAGHSLGEFAALVAASAISFEDGLRLVASRGKCMQAAVPEGEGAMAAIIGLCDDAVQALCEALARGDIVAPANFNAVGQVVIAGQTDAVDRVVAAAKPAGAKLAKHIPVSVPSHSALMQSAADVFIHEIASIDVHTPLIPVIHNVDVAMHSDAEAIRNALVTQLTQPVRWVEIIQFMVASGVNEIIECGPGKVLTGLIKRIDKQVDSHVIDLTLDGA